jgi:acyl-CoA synthetase (AMP-forming)/AMP-acid ligase II
MGIFYQFDRHCVEWCMIIPRIEVHMACPSVYQMLKAQAARAPNALAILAPECMPLTYGCLYKHVRDVGIHLQELGIGHHDRVAIVLPEASQMAVAFLAVAAGAASAPLNPHYRIPE